MMVTRIVIPTAAVLMACNVSAAVAHGTAGPGAFLRRIYAPYIAGDTRVNPTGKVAPTIFATRLAALTRKDQAQPDDEVGALDQDPICDCQDFGRSARRPNHLQKFKAGDGKRQIFEPRNY